ncbi:MAG: DegT/DnrJ/EryC1/StrS family aminotransferase [Planctomycetota bacterium]
MNASGVSPLESRSIPHSRPTSTPAAERAIAAVLQSGQHAGGRVREEFVGALTQRLGVEHGVATQSGSAALHLALLALGARPGTRVVVPSYVCGAVLNCVVATGAKPLVADIDAEHFGLNAASVRRAIAREPLSERDVVCAVVVHAMGSPAPLHEWDLDFPVIEDCAMALGARLAGREVGARGALAVFSFYATKMISCGQGGMAVTNDAALAEKLRDLIRYDNRAEWRPSWNYPLADLNAALGLAQLRCLDAFLSRRQAIADRYLAVCERLGVTTQGVVPGATPNNYRFVVRVEAPAALAAEFAADGIEAKAPVFLPLHRYLHFARADFPATERVYESALSLPIYPSLTDAQVTRVCDALTRALDRVRAPLAAGRARHLE